MTSLDFDSAKRPSGDALSRRSALVLALGAMIVATSVTMVFSRATFDDAYITFRYARHLAEGYGFGAWNHGGERLRGYTSLLWMLLLAGAARLGVDVLIASKVLGIGSALIVIA